jgi:hypothetical protein
MRGPDVARVSARAPSRIARLALAGLALVAAGPALAGISRLCDRPADVGATEQDRLLRFAAVVKQELERSERSIALIARSGLDLSRFGIRYSHAGITLKSNPNGPWSVRQLYYACDESRPRLFDQGMSGFLLGTDDPSIGYVSLVLLPEGAASSLESATLDKPRALQLLASDYSANAYAYSTRYQNCNQWVMEMIASAWGWTDASTPTREQAQHWLRAAGYAPYPVDVGSHALVFAAHFTPLVHVDDHPLDDLQALRMRISMPTAIESFVRQQWPQAERIELCHDEQRIVVHRGWDSIGADCEPRPGDEVLRFDS